jgi:ribosomal protein S16
MMSGNALATIGSFDRMTDSNSVQESVPLLEASGRRLGESFVSVKLRLKRFGRRHQPFFRLNAMDCRSPRDGRVIEELGWYDPKAKEPDKQLSLKRERIAYWLGIGAQPSDTVRQLLKRQGIAAAK